MANKFLGIREQMEQNLEKNKNEETGENDKNENTPAEDLVAPAEATVKTAESKSQRTKSKDDIEGNSKTLKVSAPVITRDVPMTRKTTAMPIVFDFAIKELKDRRNIAHRISKLNRSKITEDDIVVEALKQFFDQEGENKECFGAAQNKLKHFA